MLPNSNMILEEYPSSQLEKGKIWTLYTPITIEYNKKGSCHVFSSFYLYASCIDYILTSVGLNLNWHNQTQIMTMMSQTNIFLTQVEVDWPQIPPAEHEVCGLIRKIAICTLAICWSI